MFTKLFQKSENLAVHSCEVADYYMTIAKLLSVIPLQCMFLRMNTYSFLKQNWPFGLCNAKTI